MPTATKALKQLGLKGSSIGSFAKPNFSPGKTSNFEQQFLTSIKQISSTSVPGGRHTNIPIATILGRWLQLECPQYGTIN